jgi:hypothetical protein
MLGTCALALFGLFLIALGLINLYSRGSNDDEPIEKLVGNLSSRWWAALLLGVALLCGSVYLLWGVTEFGWPPRRGPEMEVA